MKRESLWWVSPADMKDSMPLGNAAPVVDSTPASKPAKAPPRFVGHFAGIMLDANVVDYADPEFSGRGPAAAGGAISLQSLEGLLAERAGELGAEIRYGAAVTGFQADDNGVTIQSGDATIRARMVGWMRRWAKHRAEACRV